MTRGDREQQLLDIAEVTFGERGYAETTMEEVAARAGITKPVIYDHFGSKEKLLSAVVARNRAALLAATAAAVDRLGTQADPEDCFRAGVRAFLAFFEERRASFRTYQQEAAVLVTVGGGLDPARHGQDEAIAERFVRLPALRRLAREEREGLAEIVVAANERVTAWLLEHPDRDLEEAVELVMSAVWHGFASMAADPERAPAGVGPANGAG